MVYLYKYIFVCPSCESVSSFASYRQLPVKVFCPFCSSETKPFESSEIRAHMSHDTLIRKFRSQTKKDSIL